MIFSALPFAGAAEIQNTSINQSTSVSTSGTNAVTEIVIKNGGLKKGAEGKHVFELQKWLKNQGYYAGDIDGSFGPYTKEAVKIFQKDSDIVVDGWVANQTINSMEELTGKCVFTGFTRDYTSDSKSTDKSDESATSDNTTKKQSEDTKTSTSSKKVSKDNETTNVSKKSTTSTSKSVSTTKSATSSSSLSQILASGAKYGYSHSASTAAGMMSCGSGDCWAMSDYLYSRLQAAGIESRIVQYSTAYSSRHRSVQLYQNGAWVDVPYSSYGYSTMFKATSSKPGLKVIAS
jgi:hypothetical protein